MPPSQEPFGISAPPFDPEALAAKYREERNKRLRPEGIHQYREAKGALSQYAADPWIEKEVVRDPIDADVDVLIVGGGFGGLLVAAKLIEAGVKDIRIVDKAGDFGGVWYWNRYPGVACDTESYIYLPLLEQASTFPSKKYVGGPEILAHAHSIARDLGLHSKALFQTEVLTLDWSDSLSRWTARTSRNDTLRACFVVSAIGFLHKLHLPGIPGIETFKGHSFHSSRWDYTYTGGDPNGSPLSKLLDKKIGIIGTGASAVQALPHLSQSGAQIHVFQRTPSSIDVQNNTPTDSAWSATLQPGWQDARMVNFDVIVSGGQAEQDLVNDSWTEIFHSMPIFGPGSVANDPAAAAAMAQRFQMTDFRKMEQLRSRIDEIVTDPKTAQALKPWYNRMCKRPCFHNNYLPCFNLPNVTLIDTDGKGIDRITETGVVANGIQYCLDCIIYATGFDVGTDYSHLANMTITGRHGLTLAEKWKDGPSTLHGMLGRDFPNLMMVSHLQGAATPNYTRALSERAKHVAYLVSEAQKRGIRTIEPTEGAEEGWVQTIEKLIVMQGGFFRECTPGYFSNEGSLSSVALRGAPYGLGAPAFDKLMEEWRKAGTLEGIEVDREA